MIRVTRQRHWISPELAERDLVPWGLGQTPRSLAPPWCVPEEPWGFCALNGREIRRVDWDTQLADGCHVVYSVRPGAAPSFLLGAKIAAANAAPSFFAVALPFLKSIALSLIVNALLAPGKPHLRQDQEDSTTYGFLGLQSNARGIGLPIPVVYGRHRVAPETVFMEYTVTELPQRVSFVADEGREQNFRL